MKKKTKTKSEFDKDNDAINSNQASEAPVPNDSKDARKNDKETDGDSAFPKEDRKSQSNPSKSESFKSKTFPSTSGENLYSIKNPGIVKKSLKYTLFYDELGRDKNVLVSVPVSLTTKQFLFKFQTIIEEFSNRPVNISRETFLDICKLLLRFRQYIGIRALSIPGFTTLQDSSSYLLAGNNIQGSQANLETGEDLTAVIDALKKAGFADDEINHIIKAAIDNIDRYLIRGAFTNAALRSSMEQTIIDQGDLTVITQEFPSIISGLRAAQKLYADVCNMQSVDSFGTRCLDMIQSNQTIAQVFNILKLFREYDGPTAPLSLNSFVRHSMTASGFEDTYSSDVTANGLVARVTHITSDFDVDCPRIVLVEYTLHILRLFGDIDVMTDDKVDVTTYLDNIRRIWMQTDAIASKRNNPFYISKDQVKNPSFFKKKNISEDELVHWFSQLDRLFARRFTQEVMRSVALGDSGMYAARLMSVIDQRSLERSELWSYVVKLSLDAISIFFDAFAKTYSFFASLIQDMDIYYPQDSNPENDALLQLFRDAANQFASSTLPMDHPASAKDINFLVSFPVATIDTPAPVFSFRDEMRYNRSEAVYNPIDDSFSAFFINEIKQGSIFDVSEVVPFNVFINSLLRPMKIDMYFVRESVLDFMNTDGGRALVSYPPIDQLVESGHYSFFSKFGGILMVDNAYEFALKERIPLEIAQLILDRALVSRGSAANSNDSLSCVYRYDGPAVQYVFVDPTLLPTYCVIDYPDDPLRESFVADYPFYASTQYRGLLNPIGWSGSGDATTTRQLVDKTEKMKAENKKRDESVDSIKDKFRTTSNLDQDE